MLLATGQREAELAGLPVRGEVVERRRGITRVVCFQDRHRQRVSVKKLLVLNGRAFEGLSGVDSLQWHWEKMEAWENGRQAIWANTESRQPERPQLLHFLAAAVCSQAFSSPSGEAPQAVSSPAISGRTKWGNTKVYYVARSSRPLLRRNESSKYFYGSRVRLGEGNPRKRELGEWERECGRAKKISLCHPSLCCFKAELHRFLWFLLSLFFFFYKSGKKL